MSMNENLIYGLIGLLLGGLIGGYLGGKYFAREYRGRIEELTAENEALRKERREEAKKALAERQEAAEKAEKKVEGTINDIRRGKAIQRLSTKNIEKLSEMYRSDAFDPHFADRVAPDDSDEEDDGDEEDDPFDIREDSVDEDAEEDERSVEGEIRLIDEQTFKRDLYVRDCSTYTYYQEEGILVDDSTQEVEKDQEGILGKEGMEVIPDTEKDCLYVDNGPDDTLYEVVVEHNMSYYRDVLGF